MTERADRTALILLAHGSRQPHWSAPLTGLIAALENRGLRGPVTYAALQAADPSLEQTVARLVAEGISCLCVLPLFITEGRHVQEDIPSRLAALRERYPGVTLEALPAIGAHPGFQALIGEIAGDLL